MDSPDYESRIYDDSGDDTAIYDDHESRDYPSDGDEGAYYYEDAEGDEEHREYESRDYDDEGNIDYTAERRSDDGGGVLVDENGGKPRFEGLRAEAPSRPPVAAPSSPAVEKARIVAAASHVNGNDPMLSAVFPGMGYREKY